MVASKQVMSGAVLFKLACKIDGPYFASQIDFAQVVMLLATLMFILPTTPKKFHR